MRSSPHGYSRGTWGTGILSLLCVFCAQSDAAIALGKSFATEILHLPTMTDWAVGTTFIFVSYFAQYVITAGLFEATHPDGAWLNKDDKEKKRRWLQVTDELKLGVVAMGCNVFATLLWMRYLDPMMWTYGYFDTHEHNISWFLASIPLYLICFDT